MKTPLDNALDEISNKIAFLIKNMRLNMADLMDKSCLNITLMNKILSTEKALFSLTVIVSPVGVLG